MSTNPTNIIVSKGKKKTHINCLQKGYLQMDVTINDTFNWISLLGTFTGIGVVGTVVDGITEFYESPPSNFTVQMKKL